MRNINRKLAMAGFLHFHHGCNSAWQKLLSVLAGLSEDQWEMLADIAEALAEKEDPDE